MTTTDRRYVERGVPPSVPERHVLVHNHVRHNPGTPVGTRGFRAWTQPVDRESPVVECECGWAPLAGVHYRVAPERLHRDR
jgi:hypothetical protein